MPDIAHSPTNQIAASSEVTIGDLLRMRARIQPDAIAIEDGDRTCTYARFNERVNRLANALAGLGVGHGDRVAILSENRAEYMELAFAAGKLGAILCALNWRLAAPELAHCIQLTTPDVALVSPRFHEQLLAVEHGLTHIVVLGSAYEDLLGRAVDREPDVRVHPEDGLVIIYTSGTTGLPKGALISHRAELARLQLHCLDMRLTPGDTFVAWPPMFHMVSTDQGIAILCSGGKLVIVDGFDVERLVDLMATGPMWWMVLMPGMIEQVAEAVKKRNLRPAGIKLIGAMADLVPRHQIAEITELLQAPYANTFGATETGVPPASAARIPIGVVPETLSKRQSSMCDVRLVDADDNDVADGQPGEAAVRAPSMFSGYWNAPDVNARDFRGGWFHMGDAFVRNPDGTLDFVDRVKYLIKSGGENIYPAEIERVLLADARVDDAVVVRKAHDRWGEVPVAFVAANDATLTADTLARACRQALAGYKQPKEFRFVAVDALPRSTTGKIQRHEVEKWLR